MLNLNCSNKRYLRLAPAFFILFNVFNASAQYDKSSRDALINKLNQVQLKLAPNDPSKVPVTLRLADLLSDRARIESQEDLAHGCVSECKLGEADRKTAIGLYKEALGGLEATI